MKLEELSRAVEQGRNLSAEEAEGALTVILSEETDDGVIAGFLLALVQKGETPEEILGFARVMRRQAIPVKSRWEKWIDTAGTGGGVETFNISTTAAFIIAGAGLPVAKHGNRALTSRCGSADVLAELGVNIEKPPEVAERALNEIGLAFMFAPIFHPSMKRVAKVRKELGRRTIFNMLGPLTNPSGAPYQIIGVYAEGLTEKMALALAGLGCRKGWVVHSQDGLDELSTAERSRVSEVEGAEVRTFYLDPAREGFPAADLSRLRSGTPAENAGTLRGILEGKIRGPERQVAVLNAAAALHVAGLGSLAEAAGKAEETLDSGKALGKLSELVRVYSEG